MEIKEAMEVLDGIKATYQGEEKRTERAAIAKARWALRENEKYKRIGTSDDLYNMKKNHIPFIALWALIDKVHSDVLFYVYDTEWDDDNGDFDPGTELLFAVKSDYRAWEFLKDEYANALVERIDIIDEHSIRVRIKYEQEDTE